MPLIVVLDLLGVLIEVVQLEDNVSVDENARIAAYKENWKKLISSKLKFFEEVAVIDERANELWNLLQDLAGRNVIEPPIIFLGGLSGHGRTFGRMKACLERLLPSKKYQYQIKEGLSSGKEQFLRELGKPWSGQASQIVLIDDSKARTGTIRTVAAPTFSVARPSRRVPRDSSFGLDFCAFREQGQDGRHRRLTLIEPFSESTSQAIRAPIFGMRRAS